jgi:UDP-perosamine 4-acetyltransferase
MKPRAVGLGAGGHAGVLVEIVRATDCAELAGWLDADARRHGTLHYGVRVLGADDLLARLRAEGVRAAFVAFASIRDPGPRARAFDLLQRHGFEPLKLVHPSALLSGSCELGRGVQVLPGAIVNAAATIGDNAIVNSGAIVEHDCRVGAHTHVATGARLGGGVTIGEGAHIGIGAVIRQSIRVGEGAVVGAGAVVVADVPPRAVVYGNPARPKAES